MGLSDPLLCWGCPGGLMEPVSPALPLWLGGGLGHAYAPLPGGSLGSSLSLAEWIISAGAGGKSPCIWSPLCAAAFF